MIFKFMESDAALWANHLSLSGSPHIEFQSFRVSNYKPNIPHWTTSAFSICRPMRGGAMEGKVRGREKKGGSCSEVQVGSIELMMIR